MKQGTGHVLHYTALAWAVLLSACSTTKELVVLLPGEDGPAPILCLVAGHNRVDLARLAAVTGERDVRRATAREAGELTGASTRHPGYV